MTWKVLLALILGCFAYMVIGGVIFHYVESTAEEASRISTRNYISEFIENHSCVNGAQIETLITKVVEAYDNGIIATRNSTSPTNWDIISAIFFSSTVITTIGYGHLAPHTPLGQVICAFYSIFGIPLCLVMLAGIGEKLNLLYRKIHDLFESCKKRSRLAHVLRSGLILICGIVLFLLIPAAIFATIEGWGYGEALYYNVITLTTVGFGDFVAGQFPDNDYRGVYRLCILCWIFIGLAWLASGLHAIQDTMEDTANKLADKITKITSHSEETNGNVETSDQNSENPKSSRPNSSASSHGKQTADCKQTGNNQTVS